MQTSRCEVIRLGIVMAARILHCAIKILIPVAFLNNTVLNASNSLNGSDIPSDIPGSRNFLEYHSVQGNLTDYCSPNIQCIPGLMCN